METARAGACNGCRHCKKEQTSRPDMPVSVQKNFKTTQVPAPAASIGACEPRTPMRGRQGDPCSIRSTDDLYETCFIAQLPSHHIQWGNNMRTNRVCMQAWVCATVLPIYIPSCMVCIDTSHALNESIDFSLALFNLSLFTVLLHVCPPLQF